MVAYYNEIDPYGNAIVAEAAETVVRTYLEHEADRGRLQARARLLELDGVL